MINNLTGEFGIIVGLGQGEGFVIKGFRQKLAQPPGKMITHSLAHRLGQDTADTCKEGDDDVKNEFIDVSIAVLHLRHHFIDNYL